MATAKEIAKVMGVMVHAYPRFELSPDSIKLYGQLLADIPVEVLEASAKQIMVESKFYPSIAEWREMALRLMTGAHNIPSEFEAWEEANEQVRLCGDYSHYTVQTRTPEYSHPLIEKAVEIIGYRNLLESTNPVADRAHFFKIYQSLVERAQEDMRLLPESKAVAGLIADQFNLLAKKLQG